MKSHLFTAWAFLLLACWSPKESTGDLQEIQQGESKEQGVFEELVLSCGSMPFFQKDSEIESKSFDHSGKEVASQTIQVLEVTQEGGFTSAQVKGLIRQLATGAETEVRFSYRCDGNSVFFDLASMYRTEAKAKDSNFKAGEYAFPLHVEVGETLPEISSKMETRLGTETGAMTLTIANRKVVGKESITTEAGNWDTFKITNDLKMDMELPGMDAKMKEMITQAQAQNKLTAVTWFAPEIGIVKSETYKNGVLESSNRIVRIKTLSP